jgi:hypothetical protein
MAQIVTNNFLTFEFSFLFLFDALFSLTLQVSNRKSSVSFEA